MTRTILPLTLAALAIPGFAARHDNQEKTLSCRQESDRFCEMKEQAMPVVGRVQVDGRPNGGVSVKGWSRNEILVRSQINARAESEAEARSIASQVQVSASAGLIKASGPRNQDKRQWSVSYEIFVPFRTGVKVETTNGGVKLADLEGDIESSTTNGGMTLERLAGNVKAHTTNGGMKIELDGNTWQGQGLDASTTNGGVKLAVPANYSAQMDTGTTNGSVKVDFPITVSGQINNKQMQFTLGSGGPVIRARTTNGGVAINRL